MCVHVVCDALLCVRELCLYVFMFCCVILMFPMLYELYCMFVACGFCLVVCLLFCGAVVTVALETCYSVVVLFCVLLCLLLCLFSVWLVIIISTCSECLPHVFRKCVCFACVCVVLCLFLLCLLLCVFLLCVVTIRRLCCSECIFMCLAYVLAVCVVRCCIGIMYCLSVCLTLSFDISLQRFAQF